MTKSRHGNPRSQHSAGPKHGAHSQPLGRQGHSAEYEHLRVRSDGVDAYSRVAGNAYLDSDALRGVRKRRKRRKILTGVCVSLIVVLLVGVGAAFAYVSNIGTNLARGLDSALFDVLSPTDTPEDPFYMLLMGTDGSEEREESGEFGETFRSDSMMLARIDPRGKKAALLSIPRDSKVKLGSHGTHKINAAHAFGGPALAVQTVSELTGVPISHYAEINFDGFEQIVDALGGVEVDVPMEIDDPQAGGYVPAGRQVLSGARALVLCRSRHSYDKYGDGDIFRAANQRVVLSAVAQKILSSDPFTIANTVTALSEAVLTDLSVDQIIALAQGMRGMNAGTDIYTGTVPTTSEYTNNTWYENIDMDELKLIMKRIDAGLPPIEGDEVDEATGTVIASSGTGELVGSEYAIDRTHSIRIRNGNGRDGVCAQAEAILENMGYRKFDTGNANSFDYPETLVVYKKSKNADFAQQMVQALGVGRAVQDDDTYIFESDFLVVIGADWPQ